MLIEIVLDEGDIARALNLLPHVRGWDSGNYAMRVAQAAETDHPQAALDIYRRRAKGLINARGRSNYHEAAGLLTRMQKLYRHQSSADWADYIANLRLRHRRLPALQDELNKAGL